jgi:hypothetical protein
MLKKILIGVAALVAFLIVFIATRPASFRVERTVSMTAPAEVVFPLVNDFHNWDRWSPWAKKDPNQQTTHSGAAMGQGAEYSWAGNGKVGEGRMTVTDSRPNERVGIKLEFLKPWEATNAVDFTFEPTGDEVRVTWGMTGHHNFMGKAASLFMSMDSMVGKDFEQGLASMKLAAEADARKLSDARAAQAAQAAAAEAAAAEAAAAATTAAASATAAPASAPHHKTPSRK